MMKLAPLLLGLWLISAAHPLPLVNFGTYSVASWDHGFRKVRMDFDSHCALQLLHSCLDRQAPSFQYCFQHSLAVVALVGRGASSCLS